jgi:hypothetical protein
MDKKPTLSLAAGSGQLSYSIEESGFNWDKKPTLSLTAGSVQLSHSMEGFGFN